MKNYLFYTIAFNSKKIAQTLENIVLPCVIASVHFRNSGFHYLYLCIFNYFVLAWDNSTKPGILQSNLSLEFFTQENILEGESEELPEQPSYGLDSLVTSHLDYAAIMLLFSCHHFAIMPPSCCHHAVIILPPGHVASNSMPP